LTITETPLVIWLNIVTIVARSVRLLLACAKTFMPLVNCIVNDGQENAMSNMQKMLLRFTTLVTCLDKIVCYLQRIFNRSWKLKKQVSE